MVVVEYMPDDLRASHIAAGNKGWYPHNGAVRVAVCAQCAAEICESQPEWAVIATGERAEQYADEVEA